MQYTIFKTPFNLLEIILEMISSDIVLVICVPGRLYSLQVCDGHCYLCLTGHKSFYIYLVILYVRTSGHLMYNTRNFLQYSLYLLNNSISLFESYKTAAVSIALLIFMRS